MKREIKFRAWDKVHECYLYDVQNAYDTLSGCVKDENGEDAGYDEECFAGFLDNDQYVVEQFTGLTDMNGRKIYEGDILDIGLRNQDGKPVIAPVSYETYAAGYVLDNGGNGIWQRLTEDCEVIGNTFEDKQLLEGKQ
ncbi:YopX family protein [Lacticaseibacillus paracasei subsp. paracasei]|uniref:YopX family protein n=1 Tax=Lacticaseibacillus paracasei TaxID=1597 RepID=UPI001E2A520F|nr:YopX family protein [Lacticaseibacillus paracasei]MCD0434336.1 YopX family protein [Lacticaseibacillus paracasei subsp. paracasei]